MPQTGSIHHMQYVGSRLGPSVGRRREGLPNRSACQPELKVRCCQLSGKVARGLGLRSKPAIRAKTASRMARRLALCGWRDEQTSRSRCPHNVREGASIAWFP